MQSRPNRVKAVISAREGAMNYKLYYLGCDSAFGRKHIMNKNYYAYIIIILIIILNYYIMETYYDDKSWIQKRAVNSFKLFP